MNVIKQNKKMMLLIAATFLAGFIARDIDGNSAANASEHIPNLPAEMFAKGALLRISTSEGISTGQVLDAYDTWIKLKEENDRYAYWLDTRVIVARYTVLSAENEHGQTPK